MKIKLCFFLKLCGLVCSYTKIFRYDVDIHNSDNWVPPKIQECIGLLFPQIIKQEWCLDEVTAGKIIFPEEGSLFLTNDHQISMDENNEQDMNCIRLNADKLHYWEDPESWKNKEIPNNPAVPHEEQVPCQYDEVVFPKGIMNYYVFLEKPNIKVYKLSYDEKSISSSLDLMNKFDDDTALGLTITNTACTDVSGCVCANKDMNVCYFVRNQTKFNCNNPILPIGFCHRICGASFLLRYRTGFSLRILQEHLQQYQSSTYASKVLLNATEVIQVVFTETKFLGISLEEALNFYNFANQRDFMDVTDMQISIIDIKEHDISVYIFIGSFGLVFVFFFMIFLVYDPTIIITIRNIRRNSRPLSTYLFARYDPNEETSCIVGNQSPLTSVLNLNISSFENPSFSENVTDKPDKEHD